MEESREKRKKGILRKTWERCRSFGHIQNSQRLPRSPTTPPSPISFSNNGATMVKSKSWSTLLTSTSLPSSPRSIGYKKFRGSCSIRHGCFSVYVGPDKQRFVVKVKYTSHPSFRRLLEEAELEYGFHSDGPLILPCDVDVFIRVMVEIHDDDNPDDISQTRCSFSKNRHSYHHISSPRLVSLE